ncbi:unnamed protein product [Leptidea sinapis]|uniref:Peptidase S1 domain-containing protein n=1 Tax=Leptidea sinapis TaxID=189913 RepID=A0A5E4Q9B2_9NEOP|nr:unnamed protein product [Leptidea sinapis]
MCMEFIAHIRNTIVVVLFLAITLCYGREPFKPTEGSVPFLVYFASRYRGVCVGTLLSRSLVITAAVCVTNPTTEMHDYRSITIVTGSSYRHPRRGIKVQVSKIVLPRINETYEIGYFVEKSPAFLILYRKVPDILTEIPPRGIKIDYKGEIPLSLHEECLIPGWHFFYKNDKIFSGNKFLLQRNLRAQYVDISKRSVWCETLSLKFQQAIVNLGYTGYFDKNACICVRDTERIAQPCHGMYGAPLICQGKVVGLMMAPDAQWSNCTGFTNMIHSVSAEHLWGFMNCVSRLFDPEFNLSWEDLKNSLNEDMYGNEYDFIPAVYDKVVGSSSTSEEN